MSRRRGAEAQGASSCASRAWSTATAAADGARVAGTGEAFALPTASVPRVLDEWAACSV